MPLASGLKLCLGDLLRNALHLAVSKALGTLTESRGGRRDPTWALASCRLVLGNLGGAGGWGRKGPGSSSGLRSRRSSFAAGASRVMTNFHATPGALAGPRYDRFPR